MPPAEAGWVRGDPRLLKPLIFALKVAGQNARHTSFDSVGYRDRFVTDIPRALIPDHELAPPANDGAKKSPRSAQEADGGDQASGG